MAKKKEATLKRWAKRSRAFEEWRPERSLQIGWWKEHKEEEN